MRILLNAGRIFYGLAVAETGFQTIYYKDFPYWLMPPKHAWLPGFVMLAYISGVMLILAGACIVFEKKTRPASLLLGGVLLLIFCLYYIPYGLTGSHYSSLADWENAAKELAFASGAFIIAGRFSEQSENIMTRSLGKLIPAGPILFSIPIISFGILHFQLAKEVADYVPSWVPFHLFWTYLAGTALIGSGLAIILKIKSGPIAALLGAMLLTWVIILHIPRVIVSPLPYLGGEVTSTFIALAYSGIAFVIAGAAKKK
jgi:uncharacterized membrane protein YphA (DoxX/SURF4 family)